jgi:hypothetical protein
MIKEEGGEALEYWCCRSAADMALASSPVLPIRTTIHAFRQVPKVTYLDDLSVSEDEIRNLDPVKKR